MRLAKIITALSMAAPLFAQAERRARIDVQDIKVEATVNPTTQSLQARATLVFVPLDANTQTITLELNDALKVSRATDDKDQPLTASRAGEFTIRITYPDVLPKGQPATLKIAYDGKLAGQEESPVFGIRFAAIRSDFTYLLYPARWFPVNDYTADRYTSEFTVMAPNNFKLVSGAFETSTPAGNGTAWTAKFTQPGFGGSLALVTGNPARVQAQGANTTLYLRETESMAKAYGEEVGKILSYFAGLFGPPPSAALTIVETERGAPAGYSAPGVVFLSPGTIGNQVNSRGLANQLARQWWGLSVSPVSRNHLWITNGLARYSELLYLEHLSGAGVFETDMRDAYIEGLTLNEPPLIQAARVEDYSPEYWALTGGKGAAVFNMLRLVTGEEKFSASLKAFAQQFAGKSAGTGDLRKVFEGQVGQDLGYFFIQWVESSGAPEFKLEYTIFRTAKGFRIVGKVAQDLDTFRMPVELKIETEGNPETKIIEVAGTSSEFAVETFGKPTRLVMDPSAKVLRWSPAVRVAVAIRRGEQFAEVNEFSEALKEYQKALDVQSASSLAQYRIAEIFFLQNNYQTAANSFRAVLQGDLEPKWTEVWSRIHLGKIFDTTGQRERAVNEYNLALRTKDNTQGAQEEAAKHLKEPYKRASTNN
ncbi:MAG: M1 family aminopeptidase [Acidobacteria bacterium]|nr:M1 family aminopeptidase [Acidobacteriota bacterium]